MFINFKVFNYYNSRVSESYHASGAAAVILQSKCLLDISVVNNLLV
jgi:hypothetical protein